MLSLLHGLPHRGAGGLHVAPRGVRFLYGDREQKSSRGKVVFMEIDKDHKAEGLDMERARRECRPHADGRPKSSVYLSIYRVLEHLPLKASNNFI